MLWSLIKIILFIGIVAALTWGAGLLLETQGGVTVSIPNVMEFNLTPLNTAIALGVLVVGVWVLLKLIGLFFAFVSFMNGDETALRRWSNRRREREGFEALSDAMMALASGEGRTAMAKAARAERKLQRPELTNLIIAQAAEMSGDASKAEEVYRTLLEDDRTRFVGVRGIMKQKLLGGDTETAKALAEKAFDLKPRHEETQDVLLRLQADKGDWSGARQTLGAKLKYGYLPRNVHRRRDAVLALGEAQAHAEAGRVSEARDAAIQANKLSPDLVPAAVMAAESYVALGQKRYATRVLVKAWNVMPHPDLAAAFAAIEPDEAPEARLKRFRPLTRQHVTNPETKMWLAELHLAAKDYGAARKSMGDLAEADPTARSLTIMAAIERGEGAPDSVVESYLARAVNASRGPQWVCDVDQYVAPRWVPVCPSCGGFDTLSWRVPPQEASGVLAGGGAMMPLIVGPDVANEKPVATDEAAQPIEDAEVAPAEEDQDAKEPLSLATHLNGTGDEDVRKAS
ncbi:MAG: heme biosynthesis HemY N-terminal domain-containing protein [Pseudomonadota bacterium]